MKAARMGAGAVKKLRLTEWLEIGRHGQPIRAGWYDVQYEGDQSTHGVRFYFDGHRWKRAPNEDVLFFGNDDRYSGDKWRGLAADPSKAVGK